MGDLLEIILRIVFMYQRHVVVADELPILVVVSWWEWLDFMAETYEILRLRSKCKGALLCCAIVERTNTDRITCGNVVARFCIIDDQSVLCVEHTEHFRAQLTIERK